MTPASRLAPMTETKSGLVAINIAAVIFGSAALFGKLDISPYWIVAMRGFFAALTLFLVGWMRRNVLPIQTPWRKLLRPLAATGLLLSAHWLSFFASVQLSGIAVATLTFAAFPLFTVLVTAFTLRRLPGLMQIAAGAVIVIAVALLVDVKNGGPMLSGALAGLGSALLYAFFSIHSKQLIPKMPPLHISLGQNIVVFLSLLPALPFASPAPAMASDWLWLAVLGVVTTALMLQLFLFALARLSPAVCSGFVALEPVYAVAFAALFFKEPLTVWVLVSGMMIVGASVALLLAERDKRQAA